MTKRKFLDTVFALAPTEANAIMNAFDEYVESAQLGTNLAEVGTDCISRQAAIEALHTILMYRMGTDSNKKRLDEWINNLPPAQPDIIRCKDCKHNPKYEWFGCPMSHLSEKQRPETAWCWKAERRTDEA